MITNDQRITEFYNSENWEQAKKLLQREIRKDKTNHFYLALLASIFKIEKKYSLAYKYISLALISDSKCPTVLWHFADISEAMGNTERSRVTWSHLLKQGKSKLSKNKCSEGDKELDSLLNDSRYRLALSYKNENRSLSQRYMTLFVKNLQTGTESIYENVANFRQN